MMMESIEGIGPVDCLALRLSVDVDTKYIYVQVDLVNKSTIHLPMWPAFLDAHHPMCSVMSWL